MGIFNGQHAKTGAAATATIIAKDCNITGKLDIDGNLHVDGRVSGHIQCSGCLTIGKSGRVDGEITAGKLLISGHFEGICRVENLQILAEGELKGTLYSSNMVIEPGGHFFGDSHDMTEKVSPLELVHSADKPKPAKQLSQPKQQNN